MHDHRRGQQVEPEGDVRAARQASAVGAVPPHREQERADAEQEDEAEDQVLGFGRCRRASAATSSPTAIAATEAAPAATVIGTRKRFQWIQAAAAAIAAATAPRMPASGGIVVSSACRSDAQNQAEAGGREDAADEGQQQQDRGQRHAPLRGEEQGEAPARRGDEQRARGRTVRRLRRQAGPLADPLADEADREQQDRRGNRDEDVVEAGDEPELLFVLGRQSALMLRCARASAVAASALSAPAATASSISFWLYITCPP